jgi:hypothetical protein
MGHLLLAPCERDIFKLALLQCRIQEMSYCDHGRGLVSWRHGTAAERRVKRRRTEILVCHQRRTEDEEVMMCKK